MATERPDKTCAACGRSIQWRKKWERDWDSVRYCSAACRRRGRRGVDAGLEGAILGILAERARDATLCPSEAARRVAPEGWRSILEDTRSAARRLAAAGRVEIRARGVRVDPDRAKGPIRIGRGPRFRAPSLDGDSHA